jgi:hypothetical protein
MLTSFIIQANLRVENARAVELVRIGEEGMTIVSERVFEVYFLSLVCLRLAYFCPFTPRVDHICARKVADKESI